VIDHNHCSEVDLPRDDGPTEPEPLSTSASLQLVADDYFVHAQERKEELRRLGLEISEPDADGFRRWRGLTSHERQIAQAAMELGMCEETHDVLLRKLGDLEERNGRLVVATATRRQNAEDRARQVLLAHAQCAGAASYQTKNLLAELKRKFPRERYGHTTVYKIIQELDGRLAATADELERDGPLDDDALIQRVHQRHLDEPGVSIGSVTRAMKTRRKKISKKKSRRRVGESRGKKRG